MVTHIHVNLTVKDINRSMDLFKSLGFDFNAQFTSNPIADANTVPMAG